MSMPTVAIVGRPNVGKSSLFNRILQRRQAVVEKTPGVTRDRNYAVADWNGQSFHLVDTGGLAPETDELMDRLIYDQAQFAIGEADLVVFVVDTKTGVDPVDRRIAQILKKEGKPTLLLANKADSDEDALTIYEFHKLGIGDPLAVSATSGRGMGDMLDELVYTLPRQEHAEGELDETVIRVAFVGRPNVGKSSFINKLLGQERLIVSPIAGTTRDAVDTPFEFEGRRYVLVDTAGLRRKYKVHENIEFYTSLRTTRAIDSCDVAVVLVDAQDKMTTQDQRVLEQVLEKRRACVLLVNKWDLIEKDTNTAQEFTRSINDTIGHYAWLPIIYVSALTGQRVIKVLGAVDRVYQESRRRIATSELNEFLQRTIARKHPPAQKGKY
ncbi:ribosome biogenesis GTPase Der, partial [candidate division GN15 bacterium]|nr:ribosome biogenesis GTPase Der [candidate division GN15 bacterium]